MDIINILNVMAKWMTEFFNKLSYENVLCIAAGIVGIAYLFATTHVLFGVKARTMRRARGLAKYFENNYIGSFLDAKRLIRRKRYLFNKKAKCEFVWFLNSSTNIKETDFVEKVLKPGKNSLELVGNYFLIHMCLAEVVILLKCYISGLNSLELVLFTTLPVAIMMVFKLLLFGTNRLINKGYKKAAMRLKKSQDYIYYNNERQMVATKEDIKNSVEFIKPDTTIPEEKIVSNMAKVENLLDGESQIGLRDTIMSVKDCLSAEDRAKYDEFLSKLESGTI